MIALNKTFQTSVTHAITVFGTQLAERERERERERKSLRNS